MVDLRKKDLVIDFVEGIEEDQKREQSRKVVRSKDLQLLLWGHGGRGEIVAGVKKVLENVCSRCLHAILVREIFCNCRDYLVHCIPFLTHSNTTTIPLHIN